MGDANHGCRGFETPSLGNDLWPMGFDVDLALETPGSRKDPVSTLNSSLVGGGLNSLHTTGNCSTSSGGYNDIHNLSGLSSILQRADDLHTGDICQMTDLTNSLPKGDSESAQSLLAKLACHDLGPDLAASVDPNHKEIETALFEQNAATLGHGADNGVSLLSHKNTLEAADVYGRMTCYGGKLILQLRHFNLNTNYTLNVTDCWLCGDKVNSGSHLCPHKHSLNGLFQVNGEYVQLEIEHYIIPDHALDPPDTHDMADTMIQHPNTSSLHHEMSTTRDLELPESISGNSDALNIGVDDDGATLHYASNSESGLMSSLGVATNLMSHTMPNQNSCLNSSFGQLSLPMTLPNHSEMTTNIQGIAKNESMNTQARLCSVNLQEIDCAASTSVMSCAVTTPVMSLTNADTLSSNSIISTAIQRKLPLQNNQISLDNTYSVDNLLTNFHVEDHLNDTSMTSQSVLREMSDENKEVSLEYHLPFSDGEYPCHSAHGIIPVKQSVQQQIKDKALTPLHSVSMNLDSHLDRIDTTLKRQDVGSKKRKSQIQRKPIKYQDPANRLDLTHSVSAKILNDDSSKNILNDTLKNDCLEVSSMEYRHITRSDASFVEDWIRQNLSEDDLISTENQLKSTSEIEAKLMATESNIETKQPNIEVKKLDAEIRYSNIDTTQANGEIKQSTTEVKQSSIENNQLNNGTKQSKIEIKQPNIEDKQLNFGTKQSKIEVKQSNVGTKQSNIEIKKMNNDSKRLKTMPKQTHIEPKKSDIEVKKSNVEAKQPEKGIPEKSPKEREPDQISKLAAHMLTKGVDLVCRVCQKDFGKSIKLYKIHMKDHDLKENEYFSCWFCNKTFTKVKYYTQHLKTHIKHRRFSCTLCNQSYTREEKLQRHMLKHSKEPRKKEFECTQCTKSFSAKYYLTAHMKTHEGKKFKCDVCEISCSSLYNLDVHKKIHTKDKPFKCELCEKTFLRRDFLDDHMETVHKNNKLKCDICGNLFSQKKVLKRHLATHTNEKHECKLCDKKFTRKDRLSSHMKKHTSTKLYKCSQCPATFIRKNVLDKHEKIHQTKEQCKICNVFLPSKEKLVSHMKIHSLVNENDNSERFHKCDICKKVLTSKDILRKHTRRIHGKLPKVVEKAKPVEREKSFFCQYCSKGFTRSCNLNTHILKVHLKDTEEDDFDDDLSSVLQSKLKSSGIVKNINPTSLPNTSSSQSAPVSTGSSTLLGGISGVSHNANLTVKGSFPSVLASASPASTPPHPPSALQVSSHLTSSGPPDSPINLSTDAITAAAYLLAYLSYPGPY